MQIHIYILCKDFRLYLQHKKKEFWIFKANEFWIIKAYCHSEINELTKENDYDFMIQHPKIIKKYFIHFWHKNLC